MGNEVYDEANELFSRYDPSDLDDLEDILVELDIPIEGRHHALEVLAALFSIAVAQVL